MRYLETDPAIAVSVVVPIYNARETLAQCLDSIVSQTLRDIEILLIDDGSADGSAEICKQYLSDERVRYFYKENEGLAAARQDGMERARGEYVGFVDSDDWIEPEMYRRMYETAKENAADVVFCGIYADEAEKNPVYLAPGVYDRQRIEEEILPRSLAAITPKGSNGVIRWSNCARLYRMETIKKHGIAFDRRFRRSQDLQLTFETALAAERYVSICDEYLYHNRTADNANSLSRGYTKNFWGLYRPLIDRLYQDVADYKKADLSAQMDLCTFFFAASGIQNEYYASTLPRHAKIRKLHEIASDPVLRKALSAAPADRLNKEYRAMLRALRTGSGRGVYRTVRAYEFRRKYISPCVSWAANALTEGPVTGKIYKAIRGR